MQNQTRWLSEDDDNEKEYEVEEIRQALRAHYGGIMLGTILFFFYGIGIIVFINIWINLKSVKYRLTTERLFVEKGLIAKHVEEIELYRIKDVSISQTAFQRILGVGRVKIISTDDNNPIFIVDQIANPRKIKETIRRLYRKSRRRENVTTTEFIQS